VPLLFVVRQQKSVLSWSVPYIIQSQYVYADVSHTLCPEANVAGNQSHHIVIDVTTQSPANESYSLKVGIVDDFQLTTGEERTIRVNPSEPLYFLYEFPQNVQSVVVKASSEDSICALVSIQEAQCPVYDQQRNVEFVGTHQTMTTQAAITVQRDAFMNNRFYAVFVVLPNDECAGGNEAIFNITNPLIGDDPTVRDKLIQVIIAESLPEEEFWKPIILTIGVMLCFYLIAGVSIFIFDKRKSKGELGTLEEQDLNDFKTDPDTDIDHEAPLTQSQKATYGTTGAEPTPMEAAKTLNATNKNLTRGDIDMLDDIEQEKEIYRTKMVLYVSDLARKTPKTLQRKYKLYYWNLLTISIFYVLPVMQLVLTYQLVVNTTGNEDTCYYNFLCAIPYGVLSAFNNVFSNVGYMMLGILYLFLVWRKDYMHQKEVAAKGPNIHHYGIPKHFGLHYALGIALFMEGILSGCYHVCPSYTNFQFDTAFMYIIAGLGMLKLYQQRHQDVNANAYASYACLAIVIFIAMLGVLFGNVAFYVLFAIVHFLTCTALSAQIYYMGTWKMNFGIFKRIFLVLKTDCLQCAKPVYVDRMIVLIIGNAVNWALIVFGLVTTPKDFSSYLLAILIVNLLLYMAFYMIMKLRYKERIVPAAMVFTVFTCVIWAFALYFFMLGLTSWNETPAVSREFNEGCILLKFYDGHDVWHFLSSFALFFSFLLVLTLDDDLDNVPRDKIPVF
ncbi:SID1 transmembrane family member 1-like, partial [Amphiura filiformis]|uniref:SID1 transmembrane family member 1-like n=1 Tax=Amphiura filiformis TaxID=82378 RepID=UPI003B20E315